MEHQHAAADRARGSVLRCGRSEVPGHRRNEDLSINDSKFTGMEGTRDISRKVYRAHVPVCTHDTASVNMRTDSRK